MTPTTDPWQALAEAVRLPDMTGPEGWSTSNDIAKEVERPLRTVRQALSRLREQEGAIEWKRVGHVFWYNWSEWKKGAGVS